MQFLYKKRIKNEEANTLIFVKSKMIFEFNYEDSTVLCLYKFSEVFDIQPIHFCSNEQQNIFVVASETDGVWCDTREKVDVDLDEHFNIGGI